MPRQLALLFCSIFVFCLLRYDRKKGDYVSPGLWVPTLWLLCAASRSLDVWLQVSGGNRESGGVVDPFFQAALLCLGLIILAKRNLNWSNVARENIWLVVLISYMLLSVWWSDIPLRSFRSWVKEIVAVIMALLVCTEAMPRQALESILRRTVYVLIPFSILLVKYYPRLGVVYGRWSGEIQWIGVTVQKNSLGQLCLISAFFLIWTLIRRWQGRDRSVAKYQTSAEVLLLIITLWLLKGPSMWAASATAIYALSVGLAAFFSLLWMKKHRIQLGASTWVIIAACMIGLGILTPFVGGSTVTAFTSAVGRNETLTGRTDIWAGLLPDVMRQPIFGYGFSGFWTNARIFEHDIGQAHNGYLEVCLQLGFVGLLLTAIFLLSCARKANRTLQDDFDWGCVCLCFVLMNVTESIAESSIDSFNWVMMAIVLFLSVSVPATMIRAHSQERRPVPAGQFTI